MSRRILVALDSSAGSRAALERAVELARQLEAELAGLFVEDENLRRLAELPFAAELTETRARRSLSPESMERELVRQARRLEAELEEAARTRAVPWSFRVERGQVARALLEASAGEELMVLGMSGRSRGTVRLGSTARRLLDQAGASLLLVAPRATRHRDPRVLAVFDGSEAGPVVLEHACQLAGVGGTLSVLLLGESPEQLDILQRQAAAQLATVMPVFHALTEPDGARLAQRIQALEPSTLVVGDLPQLGPGALADLLERLDGAVLQVRGIRGVTAKGES